MTTKKLKLFVWYPALSDYTAGVMFALAPDVETARKMLLKEMNYIPDEELSREPKVYTEPFALAIYGGG